MWDHGISVTNKVLLGFSFLINSQFVVDF